LGISPDSDRSYPRLLELEEVGGHTAGEATGVEQGCQYYQPLTLAGAAGPLRIIAEGLTTAAAAVAHDPDGAELGVRNGLLDGTVTGKIRTVAVETVGRMIRGGFLDYRGNQRYLHCRDDSSSFRKLVLLSKTRMFTLYFISSHRL
jgi:hypothetical protein